MRQKCNETVVLLVFVDYQYRKRRKALNLPSTTRDNADFLCITCRERTIRLTADTIRFDSIQKNIGRFDTDTIRLLNCLLC